MNTSNITTFMYYNMYYDILKQPLGGNGVMGASHPVRSVRAHPYAHPGGARPSGVSVAPTAAPRSRDQEVPPGWAPVQPRTRDQAVQLQRPFDTRTLGCTAKPSQRSVGVQVVHLLSPKQEAWMDQTLLDSPSSHRTLEEELEVLRLQHGIDLTIPGKMHDANSTA